jgi:hypothetical protein
MSNIATALKIAEASKKSITDPMVLAMAQQFLITAVGTDNPSDDILTALYQYSGILSAVTAHEITEIFLTEDEYNSMADEIAEFDNLERDILGE